MGHEALEDAFLISVQVQRVHEVQEKHRGNYSEGAPQLTGAEQETIRSGSWTGSEPITAATPTSKSALCVTKE